MKNNRLRMISGFILLLCVIGLVVPALAQDGTAWITLADNGIEANYTGVQTEGSRLTITQPGEYVLTGSLSNGQIVVDSEEDGKVKLYFAGVSIHCEDGPAVYIKKCSPRVSIELTENYENVLSDGAVYADPQSKVDAVIFSKSDLTITGKGSLSVKGAYRDGIVSKDDLRFKGGKISVEAVHNGICGKDAVEIYAGDITVHAGNDGIKSTNDDPEWGYIRIEGGTVSITCGDDPLKVVHALSVTNSTVNVKVDASLKK
ncbi:MAG: carbohydrate-binding domain-containing protein [Clostridia bacterium]|nr:carbohydrate-binding domain-containing protein [Clostridia bacterium]